MNILKITVGVLVIAGIAYGGYYAYNFYTKPSLEAYDHIKKIVTYKVNGIVKSADLSNGQSIMLAGNKGYSIEVNECPSNARCIPTSIGVFLKKNGVIIDKLTN